MSLMKAPPNQVVLIVVLMVLLVSVSLAEEVAESVCRRLLAWEVSVVRSMPFETCRHHRKSLLLQLQLLEVVAVMAMMVHRV